MSEQERAKESQTRGREAAKIRDPDEKLRYISRQGENEAFARGLREAPLYSAARLAATAGSSDVERGIRAIHKRAKRYRRRD